MKFKTWLKTLEEAQNRSRSGEALMDRSTAWGAASNFGGPRAMLPISPGFDNRAFAGVMDAIGKSRAKELERVGAEPGTASRYDKLEDIRRDVIRTANMPLQLPLDYNEGDYISITKGLIAKIKSSFNNPLENNQVWRVDKRSMLMDRNKNKQTQLYEFDRAQQENENTLEAAINYTMALIQVGLSVELSKSEHAHHLNLDRPNTKDRQIRSFPMEERSGPYNDKEGMESVKFYKVLMYVVEFKSKKNAPDVGDDLDFRKYSTQNQLRRGQKSDEMMKKLTQWQQQSQNPPTGSNPNHPVSAVT